MLNKIVKISTILAALYAVSDKERFEFIIKSANLIFRLLLYFSASKHLKEGTVKRDLALKTEIEATGILIHLTHLVLYSYIG